jgi:hypothetical protein
MQTHIFKRTLDRDSFVKNYVNLPTPTSSDYELDYSKLMGPNGLVAYPAGCMYLYIFLDWLMKPSYVEKSFPPYVFTSNGFQF